MSILPYFYDNFSVSSKLARLIGLENAAFLSAIIPIIKDAETKNKSVDGHVKINASQVFNFCGLSEEKQKECIEYLSSINMLDFSDKKIKIHDDVFIKFLTDSDEDILASLPKGVKQNTLKKDKRTNIIDRCLSKLKTTNVELLNAYRTWLESIYDKFGPMSPAIVIKAERDIDNFSNHNLDIALDILEKAAILQYRDVEWITSKYPTSNKNNTPHTTINTNVVFNSDESY